MTALAAIDWHGDFEERRRRRLRASLLVSVGLHVFVALALWLAPPTSFELPEAE